MDISRDSFVGAGVAPALTRSSSKSFGRITFQAVFCFLFPGDSLVSSWPSLHGAAFALKCVMLVVSDGVGNDGFNVFTSTEMAAPDRDRLTDGQCSRRQRGTQTRDTRTDSQASRRTLKWTDIPTEGEKVKQAGREACTRR